MTNERPILFSAPMVRALLAGRKTQTRRLYKPRYPEPYEFVEDGVPFQVDEYGDSHRRRDPFGEPGDRLWVKETWARRLDEDHKKVADMTDHWAWYWADPQTANTGCAGSAGKRRPSIFMPRWASRITLEVTGVRVERLHEISEDDALDEGVVGLDVCGFKYGDERGCQHQRTTCARCIYALLWDSIHGFNAWNKNPRVWVVSFSRAQLAGTQVTGGERE